MTQHHKASENRLPPPGRLPPHNIDCEEAVLSALLIADADFYFYAGMTTPTEAIPQSAIDYHQAHLGPAVAQTLKLLEPSSFYRDRHGWIFSAILELKRTGSKVNATTVAHQLAINGKLEATGGAAYLSHLIANCPTTVFIVDYAEIIHKCAINRGLIGAARQIEELGYQGGDAGENTKRARALLGKEVKPPKGGMKFPLEKPPDE